MLNQIMDNGINPWKGLDLSPIDKSSNTISHQMYVNFIRLLLSVGYCNQKRLAQNDLIKPCLLYIFNTIEWLQIEKLKIGL